MNIKVIGLAGCGSMGLPMAQQLFAAGFDVWGFDLRPPAEFDAFQSRMISNPQVFAAKVDTLISVVRDYDQTLDLFFDQQALFSGHRYPKNLILCSTLSPKVLPKIVEHLPKDVTVIDAPMSGAPDRARDGTLTFMVGGDDPDVKAMMPLFKAMGDKINYLGPLGRGMTCKVINNFVAVTTVAAVRKAIEAAKALDMNPEILLNVMRTSSGGTWYGNNIRNISWAHEPYDPTNTIGILEKDMLAFLDATLDNPKVTIDHFAASVLEVIRNIDTLEM